MIHCCITTLKNKHTEKTSLTVSAAKSAIPGTKKGTQQARHFSYVSLQLKVSKYKRLRMHIHE